MLQGSLHTHTHTVHVRNRCTPISTHSTAFLTFCLPQFDLGNLFGGGNKPPPGKQVSLEEAGVVPDIIPEKFATKTTLRVKYPAWVKSAVNLKDVSSFGGTPTRGAGEIGMGQVRIVQRKSVLTRLCAWLRTERMVVH